MNSKSKKIQGKELNKFFTNCKIPNTITDGRLMAVNDKYLIMAWNCNNPGTINMVDSNNPCNLNSESNTFSIESSNILDMEFSPFDSNVFSFSNENKSIHVLKLVKPNEIKSDSYKLHLNKVYFINFNPVASNIICSSTSFGEIHIWDSVKFQKQIDFKVSNNINSILWNPCGSLLGISTTNKLITIIDPRSSTINFEQQMTDINARTKFVWLNDFSLAAIGYKLADKQFYLNLYDIRQTKNNPFSSIKIGSYGSALTPFVDPELNLIYLTAKDDYYIKLYDYSSGVIQKYGDFLASEYNNFTIQLNRKYLNKRSLEIDKFARYTKNGKILYVSFFLKDIKIDYNESIYPNEESYYPKMTSEEWFLGEKILPKKVHSNNNKNNSSLYNQSNTESKKRNKQYINDKKYLDKDKNENMKKNYNNYINNNVQPNNLTKSNDNYSSDSHSKLSEKIEPNEIEILKRNIKELQNKNQLLENEKNKIIQEKNEEKEKYEYAINSLNIKMNAEQKKYNDELKECNRILESKENEIRQIQDILKKSELKIKLLEEEKEKYLKENNELKQKYELISQELNSNNIYYKNKISLLKEQLKKKYEDEMNKKIELINNQYKENALEELNKAKKNLIKTLGINLKNLKDKYNNIYSTKEEELNQKCKEILKLNINTNEKEIYYNKINKENINLKKEISRFPFSLSENEYIILLIIITKDEKVMFPLISKNTDDVKKLKEIFFKEFPEYSENKGIFYKRNKNNLLKSDKTLEECNIKSNDIIIFEYE